MERTLRQTTIPDRPCQSRDERGDTLIEILVTITVLGLAVVGLIGALLTSTATSATHRNSATIDAVLRNLSDSARFAIETQPYSGNSGLNPQFQPCAGAASSYYVVGAPYPNSAAPNSTVTVFSIGTSATDTVKLIGSTAIGQTATTTLTPTVLNAATNVWSLTIPSGASAPLASATPYTLQFTHNGTNYTAPGGLIVTSGTATSSVTQFANYSVTATLSRWNSATSSFDSTVACTSTSLPQIQQLAITVASTQTNSGATATENVLLSNLAPLTPVSLSVPDVTVNLGQSATLTATISGVSGSPTANDKIVWSNLGGNSCSGGNTQNLSLSGVNWQAHCSLGTLGAQSFQPTASYQPPSNSTYSPASTTSSLTVNKATPTGLTTSRVAPATTPTALGNTVEFQASLTGAVAGFPIGGTVTWTNLPAGTTCSEGNPSPVNSGTATCTINSNLVAGAYTPTATYNGDSNYVSGANDHTATVTENKGTPSAVFNPTVGVLQVSPSSMLFTVDVTFPSQAVAPTGAPTWVVTATGGGTSHPSCSTTTGPTTSGNTSTYTCEVSSPSALKIYTATFQLPSDSNYNASNLASTSAGVPG